jgi:octaprenyl-diphosphate synthase
MATLLHDDIVDNSDVRRQQPSPLAKFGMAETLIAGDFLLTRAFSLCSRLDRVIIDATESACISLTEGETEEFSIPLSAHNEASTIRIARKKTAALFRLGAFSAAFLAGVSRENQEHLACFGESLGIAFQILDDILDITGDQAVFGKKTGTDIRERKPSLINVLWLASGDKLASQTLLGSIPSDSAIQEAIYHLKDSQVMIKAREIATQYGEKASQALASINQINTNLEVRTSLNNLISFTLARLR